MLLLLLPFGCGLLQVLLAAAADAHRSGRGLLLLRLVLHPAAGCCCCCC